jgi:hypothetical protein
VCADLTLTYGSPSVTVTNRTLLSSSCEFSCYASAYASEQGGLGSASLLGSPTLDPRCEALWRDEQYARLYVRAATSSTSGWVNVSSAPAWLGAYFKPGTAGWPITAALPVNAKAVEDDAKARKAFEMCEAQCGGESVVHSAAVAACRAEDNQCGRGGVGRSVSGVEGSQAAGSRC